MEDFIILAILAVILGSVCVFLYKSRKRGIKCVGCPDAKTCSSANGCAGCNGCCGGES